MKLAIATSVLVVIWALGVMAEDPPLASLVDCRDMQYILGGNFGPSAPQSLDLEIDLLSSDIWVPVKGAKGNFGRNQHRYDGSKSQSYKSLGDKSYTLKYINGNLTGTLAKETFYLDEEPIIEFKNRTFIEGHEFVGTKFNTMYADGSMGLAPGNSAVTGEPSPVMDLFNQGLIEAPMAGLHFWRNLFSWPFTYQCAMGGTVAFGGPLTDMYVGRFTYIQMRDPSRWQLDLESIQVGARGEPPSIISSNCGMSTLDTTLGPIRGPKGPVEAINKLLKATKVPNHPEGLWVMPSCRNKNLPDLTFIVQGGHKIVLEPEDYILTLNNVKERENICYSSFATGPQDTDIDHWILTSVFLSAKYWLLDLGNKRLGFADLA